MPTQLKSDTARANGAKSHGPKTAEGRATSSRNATRHGLSSRNPLVLECENDDDFQALLAGQMEIHQPATPAEIDLVDQMVAARWRILRLQSIESNLLDSEMRLKMELEQDHGTGRKIQLSDAYTCEVNRSRAMALASRCESRLQRTYQSSYKILRELQAARAKQSTQPVPLQAERPQPTEKMYGIKPKAAFISNAAASSNPSNADNEASPAPGNRESDASL